MKEGLLTALALLMGLFLLSASIVCVSQCMSMREGYSWERTTLK